MHLLQALILSIIEGVTEFLPISSTGHLILFSKLLYISQSEFVKSFEIAIQAGAILSVIFLYGKRLLIQREELKRVTWVFIPTGLLGFLLYKSIKTYLLGNYGLTIDALFFGGIAIIILERYFKTKSQNLKISELSLKNSLILGVIQVLSVIPGVSRSATTIFGGMFLGLSRGEATELSFIVALPVMVSATGLDLVKSAKIFSMSEIYILLFGLVASFLVSLASIKWLLAYIKNHDFTYFGIYRIIIAVFFTLLVR